MNDQNFRVAAAARLSSWRSAHTVTNHSMSTARVLAPRRRSANLSIATSIKPSVLEKPDQALRYPRSVAIRCLVATRPRAVLNRSSYLVTSRHARMNRSLVRLARSEALRWTCSAARSSMKARNARRRAHAIHALCMSLRSYALTAPGTFRDVLAT